MQVKLIRALVTLGVPGVALGKFYLLLRSLNFQFSLIGPEATAVIAIIFLIVVGVITLYALHQWSPLRKLGSGDEDQSKTMVLAGPDETVTLTEPMRSVAHDIVKISAHTHQLGVEAEYEWTMRRYPKSQILRQSLVAYNVPRKASKSKQREIYFDRLEIQLSDGRKKGIYFDISNFFSRCGLFTY